MKHKSRWAQPLVILILLAGCGGAEPTPVPTQQIDTLVPSTPTISPTETQVQATTQTPELTATSLPQLTLTGAGGGVIAFSSTRDGNEEIYVMNADGSDQRRLTNDPAYDHLPNWSPDGARIVFTTDRRGDFETYVMNTDGSDATSLGGGGWSIWSTDGSQIAFLSWRGGDSEIHVMPAPEPYSSESGDGQWLTNNNAGDWEPAWSPDGSQIAFVSNRDGNAEIYLMNADGSDQKRLTYNQTDEWAPAWSPDGTQLAFISDREDPNPLRCQPYCNYEIYVLNLQDALQSRYADWQRLTNNNAVDNLPAWSPDGTRLAFFSDRDGDAEIYVMDVAAALQGADDVEVQQLTDNNFDDFSPAWRPEGPSIKSPLSIQVPEGSVPVIDGNFSEGEWEDALVTDLVNAGELMLMHAEGYLYLGIRSREMGFGSICTIEGDQISILHSSAGLGTAVFERDIEDWRRIRQFSYCCWGANQRELDDFLQREGWVASVGTRGEPDEMEYQIQVSDGELTLAVVYIDDFTFETPLYWPDHLDDDCLGLALIPEDPPERLSFSPETWVTIVLSTE
ncbi:MAG: PD40 domain-containing protein [Anaerolineaceae bacterium]|nr:MAG: PD40 domain-containing protein [Anaerolineaceae bacterium]